MTLRTTVLALVLLVPATGFATTATVCATLGDRLRARPDTDTFLVTRTETGETIDVVLDARPGTTPAGSRARLTVGGKGGGRRQGALPLTIHAAASTPPIEIRVRELGRGGRSFRGPYCVTVRSSAAAAETLARADDVEVE